MLVAGILSGTSVDGIDVAFCTIDKDGTGASTHDVGAMGISIRLEAFATVPFEPEERKLIFSLFRGGEERQANAAAERGPAATATAGAANNRTPIEAQASTLSHSSPAPCSAEVICKANFEVGRAFGRAVCKLAAAHGFVFPGGSAEAGERSEDASRVISVVGSHGQTIWHDVCPNTGHVTSTLQIGEPAVIAEMTGCSVVGDFRVADVAAGGQGAPLTSTFDQLLFSKRVTSQRNAKRYVSLQNIGGFGNVTFVQGALSADDDGAIDGHEGSGQGRGLGHSFAFDTGPGNVLMDWAMTRLTRGERTYDAGGSLASQGKVVDALLGVLLEHPFLHTAPPKTTGREVFDGLFVVECLRKYASHIGNGERGRTDEEEGEDDHPPWRGIVSDGDLLATLTEFTARTIVDSYVQWGPLARNDDGDKESSRGGHGDAPSPVRHSITEVIIHGGGALNHFLVARIRHLLHESDPSISVLTSDDVGIPSDAKEAMLFALLAYLTIHGMAGNVPSATGARHRRVLGKIVPGSNYLRTIVR